MTVTEVAFPRTPEEAVATTAALGGEYRAGGTDVQERHASGVSTGAVVDLRELRGLDRIERRPDGGARIGALARVAAIAAHVRLRRSHPALAAAAAALAPPQIRAVATLGGNLLQQPRCRYYRHPTASCLRKGGDGCPARAGNHRDGVCFDLGPCAAPHPSTLAVALLAYGATAKLHGAPPRPLGALLADGPLAPGERPGGEPLLTWVEVPSAPAGESAAYVRVTSRRHGEWPLVEVAARLLIADDGTVAAAAVAAGGVAPVPLHLRAVEEALTGGRADPETLGAAAAAATAGAAPLPQTRYKLRLLQAAVLEALEQAANHHPTHPHAG